jgi:hypothetical protein
MLAPAAIRKHKMAASALPPAPDGTDTRMPPGHLNARGGVRAMPGASSIGSLVTERQAPSATVKFLGRSALPYLMQHQSPICNRYLADFHSCPGRLGGIEP